MHKTHDGLRANTALATLKDEGIDPSPFFNTVADNLLHRHGGQALRLAREAIARLGRAGDSEGVELWRELSRLMQARAVALVPVGEAIH